MHGGQTGLVILDGLAELTWMGFEARRIQQFVRAVLAQVHQVSTTSSGGYAERWLNMDKTESAMVSILHADHLPLLSSSPAVDPSTPEVDLLHRLMRISNGWWRVSSLSSGRSGNVSGEVSRIEPSLSISPNWTDKQISSYNLHSPSPHKHSGTVHEVPRSKPLQYRLESNTVRLFAKGTGRGYL